MTLYLEDYPVGTIFQSGERVITGEDIDRFCDLSGDHNPLHKDDQWVRANTPFKQRIAHGLLVLSIASGMPCPQFDDMLIIAYLSETRNFRAPTYPGEAVRCFWEVVENRPSNSRPDAGLLRLTTRVEKSDGTVVQDGEDLLLVGRRALVP